METSLVTLNALKEKKNSTYKFGSILRTHKEKNRGRLQQTLRFYFLLLSQKRKGLYSVGGGLSLVFCSCGSEKA